jgi:hypothetical protein
MSGQVIWDSASNGPGGSPVTVNNYVVKEEVVADIYTRAVAASMFGKLNGLRNVDVIEIAGSDKKFTIGSGKDSPIWEKKLDQNNTALFTAQEPLEGMPTYGDTSVKPGGHRKFFHAMIQAITISTPAYPLYGHESQYNIKRVIPLKEHEARLRQAIAMWIQREYDLDGMRALLYGLSRGLYLDTDGGKASQLYGATANTRWRAPWNSLVANVSGLVAQNAGNAETHNNALGAAINTGLAVADDTTRFSWKTTKDISAAVDALGMRNIRLNGSELRAVVLMDPRNLYSLREDDKLVQVWAKVTPRQEKNFLLYSRDHLILDDILYLPWTVMSWFRPKVQTSGQIERFGVGMDVDPRVYGFRPATGKLASDVTLSIVLGAGALRRGNRPYEMNFTKYDAPHGKGSEIAAHWDDGWMRNDWYSKDDGGADMYNDSSLFVFNRDANDYGIGI